MPMKKRPSFKQQIFSLFVFVFVISTYFGFWKKNSRDANKNLYDFSSAINSQSFYLTPSVEDVQIPSYVANKYWELHEQLKLKEMEAQRTSSEEYNRLFKQAFEDPRNFAYGLISLRYWNLFPKPEKYIDQKPCYFFALASILAFMYPDSYLTAYVIDVGNHQNRVTLKLNHFPGFETIHHSMRTLQITRVLLPAFFLHYSGPKLDDWMDEFMIFLRHQINKKMSSDKSLRLETLHLPDSRVYFLKNKSSWGGFFFRPVISYSGEVLDHYFAICGDFDPKSQPTFVESCTYDLAAKYNLPAKDYDQIFKKFKEEQSQIYEEELNIIKNNL